MPTYSYLIKTAAVGASVVTAYLTINAYSIVDNAEVTKLLASILALAEGTATGYATGLIYNGHPLAVRCLPLGACTGMASLFAGVWSEYPLLLLPIGVFGGLIVGKTVETLPRVQSMIQDAFSAATTWWRGTNTAPASPASDADVYVEMPALDPSAVQ